VLVTVNVLFHNTCGTGRYVRIDEVGYTVTLEANHGGVARVAVDVSIMLRELARFQPRPALGTFEA